MLTVIKEAQRKELKCWEMARMFECECNCWNLYVLQLKNLRNWNTKSCWCLQKNTVSKMFKKHWMSGTKPYGVWSAMIERCGNVNDKHYEYYWWRWISVCDKRQNFQWFWDDMQDWYKEWLTLDRINNNWNYEKLNCEWVTRETQSNNTRGNKRYLFMWKNLTIREICNITGQKYWLISWRLQRGWSIIEATSIGKNKWHLSKHI